MTHLFQVVFPKKEYDFAVHFLSIFIYILKSTSDK